MGWYFRVICQFPGVLTLTRHRTGEARRDGAVQARKNEIEAKLIEGIEVRHRRHRRHRRRSSVTPLVHSPLVLALAGSEAKEIHTSSSA